VELKRLFDERVSFVYGPSGAGKTVLVSRAAFELAKEGLRVVWVSFNEGKESLHNTWTSFGWDPRQISVFDYPYVPQYKETLFNQVIDLAYREKADVFIVDGVEAIVFDRATADAFVKMGIRTIVGIEARYNPMGDIADVIVRLTAKYTSHATIRRVEIRKARGVGVTTPVYYMAILPSGPVLLTDEQTPTLEEKRIPPPGLLANIVREVPLGTQIALYGPYQRISATVVDAPNSIAYVHRPYQWTYFKKAKPKLVSIYEHRRLEHYAEKLLSRYVITLDAELVPRAYRRFRSRNAVWVDIYTAPPNPSEYDYVLYVDSRRIKVEHSPEPVETPELPLQ